MLCLPVQYVRRLCMSVPISIAHIKWFWLKNSNMTEMDNFPNPCLEICGGK